MGEEGYVIIHVCSREPSTGCLEELNTVSTLESGVQEAMTKSTKTCKKKKKGKRTVPDATLGQTDLTPDRGRAILLNE